MLDIEVLEFAVKVGWRKGPGGLPLVMKNVFTTYIGRYENVLGAVLHSIHES